MKHFSRPFLAFLLAVCFALPLPSLGTETTPLFSEPSGAWFGPYVEPCIRYGFMDSSVMPEETVSVAQCILWAVQLHQLQNDLSSPLPQPPENWPALAFTGEDGGPLFFAEDYLGYSSGKGRFVLTLPEERVIPLEGQAGYLVIDGESYSGTFVVGAGFWDTSATGFLLDQPVPPTLEGDLNYANWVAIAPPLCRSALYYAENHGLRFGSLLMNANQPACRLDLVHALTVIMDPAELPILNQESALPDSLSPFPFGDKWRTYSALSDNALSLFYQTGIVAGVDDHGTFAGERALTYAEAAAILARVIIPELRLQK